MAKVKDFEVDLTPDEKAKSLVMGRLETARSYRKANYDKNWNSYQMQYRSKIENPKEYDYMAKLFIPYSFTSVETTVPRMAEALFASEPIVAVKPWERKDVENAQIQEKLLSYQYNRMDFFNNFILLAKMCLIYGTCIGKADWRREAVYKKRIKYIQELNEFGMPTEVPALDKNGKVLLEKYPIEIWNDPYIYPVDIYKFFIDPRALSVEDAEYVIMITETTMAKLRYMQKMGIYKNVSKIEDIKGKTKPEEGKERYSNVDKTSPQDISDKYSDRVTLYEYWENDRVIVLAEEDIVIRDSENPYWHCKKPFISAKICPTENEFYGVGLMEMVQSLQNELNDIRNQRMDNIKLAINRTYLVDRNADIPQDMLVNEPGGAIYTNFIDGLKILEAPDVTGQAFTEAKIITDDIQHTHGIYDYSKGATPKQRETATGILSLQEAANIRFKMMIMTMARNLLGKGSAIIVDLNQQYLPRGKEFRLTGQSFSEESYNITPEELVGRYDYEPVGASMEGLSKYARLEQLLRFRQTFVSNPSFNINKFDKELLELLNFKDADKYFVQQMPTGMEGMQEGQFPTSNIPQAGGIVGAMPPQGIGQPMGY